MMQAEPMLGSKQSTGDKYHVLFRRVPVPLSQTEQSWKLGLRETMGRGQVLQPSRDTRKPELRCTYWKGTSPTGAPGQGTQDSWDPLGLSLQITQPILFCHLVIYHRCPDTVLEPFTGFLFSYPQLSPWFLF